MYLTPIGLRTFWKRLLQCRKGFMCSCECRYRLLSTGCEKTKAFTVKEILILKPVNDKVSVQGWVQSVRKHRSVTFLDVCDGSCLETLQVIDEKSQKKPSNGSSVKVTGLLVNSTHSKQEVELQCEGLTILGNCDAAKYPFQSHKGISVKQSREKLHLRPRLKSFSSLLRIRSYATLAIHKFLQENGFFHIDTPIITSNNCEGAGDLFSVHGPGGEAKFFNIPVYLTVSGQLHLEAAASGLSKVYKFGPAFRAENSRTRRHLSEFQMVEVEQAFVAELNELLELSENLFKAITQHILETCPKDVELCHTLTPNYNKQIEKMITLPFVRLTYSEAVRILEKNQATLQNTIKWGETLLSEHEDFLLKYSDGIPVFVTDYPINKAPFYMKRSSDKTVACFDLIAPIGGEIFGGSLREVDKDQLENRINSVTELGQLSWYLELREFGPVPLGGFGMGFDRFLQTVLGIPNIRETVPYPRWAHHCQM